MDDDSMNETTVGQDAAEPTPQPRRLYRRSDGRIAGVAGGLADYLRVDPALIRLAFVVSIFIGGIGLIAYLVAWLVIPTDDEGRPGNPDRSSTASLTTVIGIVLLVTAVMIGVFSFDGPFGGGAIIPLAMIAGGIFLLTQTPGKPLLGAVPAAKTDPLPSPQPSVEPQSTVDPTEELPPPPPPRLRLSSTTGPAAGRRPRLAGIASRLRPTTSPPSPSACWRWWPRAGWPSVRPTGSTSAPPMSSPLRCWWSGAGSWPRRCSDEPVG